MVMFYTNMAEMANFLKYGSLSEKQEFLNQSSLHDSRGLKIYTFTLL